MIKFFDLIVKDEKKTKQGKKLWGKIVKASQNMADRLPSLRDDRGPGMYTKY